MSLHLVVLSHTTCYKYITKNETVWSSVCFPKSSEIARAFPEGFEGILVPNYLFYVPGNARRSAGFPSTLSRCVCQAIVVVDFHETRRVQSAPERRSQLSTSDTEDTVCARASNFPQPLGSVSDKCRHPSVTSLCSARIAGICQKLSPTDDCRCRA